MLQSAIQFFTIIIAQYYDCKRLVELLWLTEDKQEKKIWKLLHDDALL